MMEKICISGDLWMICKKCSVGKSVLKSVCYMTPLSLCCNTFSCELSFAFFFKFKACVQYSTQVQSSVNVYMCVCLCDH